MAVVIPNSTETTGGNPYASLEQAEPDSLDFEIAGNSGRGGVLYGCEVTTNGSATDVSVSAGEVVIDGSSYSVSLSGSLTLPTSPTDTRYDIVVARGSTLTVVSGVESSGNPTYPPSTSVDSGGGLIDFDTDTVLAAILRVGGGAITSKEIVDKRAMFSSTIPWQGSSLPATAPPGSMFFLTTTPDQGFTGMYVRGIGSQWIPIGQTPAEEIIFPEFPANPPPLPIGCSLTWEGSSPPAGYLLCDGSAISRSTYSALFDVIGTRHGSGNGSTTFNIPNKIGRVTRGSIGSNVGNTGGATTVTLGTSNMPIHNHGLNNHTHTHAHWHNGPTHRHTMSLGGGGHSHYYQQSEFRYLGFPYENDGLVQRAVVGWPGSPYASSLGEHYVVGDSQGSAGSANYNGTDGGTSVESHSHSGDTGWEGSDVTSGVVGGNTTSPATPSDTTNAGGSSSFSIVNPYIDGMPIIKAFL